MKLVQTIRNFLSRFFNSAPTTDNTPAPKAAVKVEDTRSPAEKIEARRQQYYANLDYGYRGNWDGYFEAIQYLIDSSETMEHLQNIVRRVGVGSHRDKIDLEQLWNKWIEKATQTKELEHLHAYSRLLSEKQKMAMTRKWYALATNYGQIAQIPETEDEILNGFIWQKKITFAAEALDGAKTCAELIEVWTSIESGLQPKSLACYPSWDKDEDLSLSSIISLLSKSTNPFYEETDKKWLKVSLREIEAAKDTNKTNELGYKIHQDARAALNAKWDSLSASEVASATEEDDIVEALRRSRNGSDAKQNGRLRLDAINMVRTQKATTLEELWVCIFSVGLKKDYPSAILAITKYADLATTEDEIRSIWPVTDHLPPVRVQLTQKLSKLIK